MRSIVDGFFFLLSSAIALLIICVGRSFRRPASLLMVFPRVFVSPGVPVFERDAHLPEDGWRLAVHA